MNLTRDVTEIANDLLERLGTNPSSPKLSYFEALQIAVQIQRNDLYCKANVLKTDNVVPSALESIAMNLEKIGAVIHQGVDVTNHY